MRVVDGGRVWESWTSGHLWILAVGTATTQPRSEASLPTFGARSSPPKATHLEFILASKTHGKRVQVEREAGDDMMKISNVHRQLAV